MNKIVTINSFRQSVGKSTLSANLAVLMAMQGRRVALIDTDFQGASAHLFFGLGDTDTHATFNDYLTGNIQVTAAAHDLTERLPVTREKSGKLYLLPASTQITDIMKMLRSCINIERYNEGLASLEKELALDVLLVDTRAGLNENTMTAISISHTLLLVLHPDSQDFQGTAVTVEVARKLQVPNIRLVLNDGSPNLDPQEVSKQMEETYHCGGGVVLNHTEELLALASSQPFVLAYPNHPLTKTLQDIADTL